jgi:hypothetical protein
MRISSLNSFNFLNDKLKHGRKKIRHELHQTRFSAQSWQPDFGVDIGKKSFLPIYNLLP